MTKTARVVGGASIVLTPLLLGAADLLRMRADGSTDGIESQAAIMEAIEANRGAYELASWLAYAGALLSIPALVALWCLAVDRSRVWAWTGAVLATLGVTGQMVHLVVEFGLNQALAGQVDSGTAADVVTALQSAPFNLVLFLPFLVFPLAWVPQVVGLRRARVVPVWALLAVLASVALIVVVGSQPWASAVWTAGLVAGFAPAAVAMLRGREEPAWAPAATEPVTA